MLLLFRKKKEWLKWTLLLVIIALGVTTALMFVNTPQGLTSGLGAQEVAKVADQPINAAEFRRFYLQLMETYRQLYNLDQGNSEIIKQLGIGQQALNQLVNRYALSYEASRVGLNVSDAELVEQISRFPAFQANGQFIGSEQYRNILRNNNLTPQDFEESLRRDLMTDKLQQIVTDGIRATSADARKDFLERNQEVKVRYVTFDPEKLQQEAVSDEALKTYYDENQDAFRKSEKRRIEYVNIYVAPTDVEPTEEEITAALSDIPDEEQVRARHILVRFDPNNPESAEEALAKTNGILRRIRNGEDFAKVAEKESDDTSSAVRGGDLGFFSRGEMVPEFESTAFGLEPGQISDPVKSAYGYHIIQTLEKSSQAEESRRPAAAFNARLKKAQEKADEVAKQVQDALSSGQEFGDVASSLGLEILDTGFRTQAEGFPRLIGSAGEFTNQVFNASVGEAVGPITSGWNRFIGVLKEIQAAELPEFDSIRTEIETKYRAEQADVLAKEAAFDFFHKAETADSFETAAKESDLDINETDFFKKGATIDDNLKFSPLVHDQAFSLDIGQLGTPVLVTGKYFVFQVTDKSEVDEAQYEREKPDLIKTLTTQKKAQVFQAFTQNVVTNLREEEMIIVNQQLLNDLTS